MRKKLFSGYRFFEGEPRIKVTGPAVVFIFEKRLTGTDTASGIEAEIRISICCLFCRMTLVCCCLGSDSSFESKSVYFQIFRFVNFRKNKYYIFRYRFYTVYIILNYLYSIG